MKTTINIKADMEVKENAQKLAEELGVPLSVVINAFLREFLRNRSFSFSAVPKMTPYLENIISKVETDIKSGNNMSKAFNTTEEANNYLDSL